MSHARNATATRRSILAGLAAVLPVAAAAPAVGAGADDSELLGWIREWHQAKACLEPLYAKCDEAEALSQAAAAAHEAIRTAIADLDAIEDRIARTRAVTPAGMLQKARMALADTASRESLEEELERVLDSRYATADFIGISLILDLLSANKGMV
jgi:hypothetical protein